MKKKIFAVLLMIAVGAVGCGAKTDNDTTIIGGADGPTSVFLSSNASEDEATDDLNLAISGTWQTASIGYEDGDEMQPEYYVQFTETEVNYGHMKDGAFAVDHSDKISEFETNANGEYIVKAESADGVKYTYRTAEGDADVLEYYETWNEDDFSEKYRAGASLSRNS